jgi:HEAT repeat protein
LEVRLGFFRRDLPVNGIRELLSGGDLRSDGLADEAAEYVLENPELFEELLYGLGEADEVIRGRAADALEKVARERPDLFVDRVGDLIAVLECDKVPMVRWHLAMIFGHLAGDKEVVEQVTPKLLALLEDSSVFVKSWAVTSLCIIGRKYPEWRDKVTTQVQLLDSDPSVAIRSRVRKALELLNDDEVTFPKGWIKSKNLDFTT